MFGFRAFYKYYNSQVNTMARKKRTKRIRPRNEAAKSLRHPNFRKRIVVKPTPKDIKPDEKEWE
jgi:hypothetical protein